MPGKFILTELHCSVCNTDKNIREFSEANVWKLKEERYCKQCYRLNKTKNFKRNKKIHSLMMGRYQDG